MMFGMHSSNSYTDATDPALVDQFHTLLFDWHTQHRREMPWRNTSDPFLILVSEIMLQQTQVDRVRDRYAIFVERFPTLEDLACATLGEVLQLWSGLGYNRRAKYLFLTAKYIVSDLDGVFPSTPEELLRLPGVGLSTMGALSAFSFGADTPMIDTNIRRVLHRVFFSERTLPSDRQLYDFASSIIPVGNGREWNYAMLDCAAMVCTARHHSSQCPLMALHGEILDVPRKTVSVPFMGSRRFYRGKILASLARQHALTIREIQRELHMDPTLVKSILDDLSQEGMISIRGEKIVLP